MNLKLNHLFKSYGQSVEFKKDTVLFHDGDQCRGLLVVNDGSVKVLKYSSDGKEAVLYRVTSEYFCILSISCLLGKSVYNAVGIAETSIKGYYLSQEIFLELLHTNFEFREFVFKNLADRITGFIQKIDDITFKSLKQRLIDFLNSQPETIQITHYEIAIELGTSREVISRLLKTLQLEGRLNLSRSTIKKI